MSTKSQIDHAMKLMDSDPALAVEFDKVRATEFPNKSRREAAELALAALEAKKNAGLAAERSKALKHLAGTAATKFRSFVTMGRPDKRQTAVPFVQWNNQHLMQAALVGDKLALAELGRRGFELNANQTFSKKA